MAKKKAIKRIPNKYFIEVTNEKDWDILSDWLFNTIDYTLVRYWIIRISLTNKQYNWILGRIEANRDKLISTVSIYCKLK